MVTNLKFTFGKSFDFKRKALEGNRTKYGYANVLKMRYSLKSYVNKTGIDEFSKLWELEFLKFMRNLKTNLTCFKYIIFPFLTFHTTHTIYHICTV